MTDEEQDHRRDVLAHIFSVREYLDIIADELGERGYNHDQSKLEEPEFSGYMGLSEAVKGLAYGSMAYRAAFAPYKEVIQHHYQHNDHHIEHNDNGLSGMSLTSLAEMMADWKAASSRSPDGSIMESLEIGRKRYDMSDQLYSILLNTIKELGWS